MSIIELLLACRDPEPQPAMPPWQLEPGGCPEAPVGDLQVRLVGEWNLTLSTPILAELDGDPCVELLVAEADRTYESNARLPARVTLVEAPLADGLVAERHDVVLQATDDIRDGHVEANSSTYDHVSGEFITDGGTDDGNLGAWRLERGMEQGPADLVGELDATPGDVIGALHSAWQTSRGVRLLTTKHTSGDLDLGFAGMVTVFPLPLRREKSRRDQLARVFGREDEMMYTLESRFPLVGDPLPDLAFGVFEGFGGHGGIALVDHLPPGDHEVWDVATTTIEGEGGELGYGVAGGDLDRDGAPDLLAGAALFEDTGRAYAFRGPLPAGAALTVADADWTFTSDQRWSLTGAALAVGDFDGDGAPDLAIGQPRNWNFTDEPGAVAVFRGPLDPGRYRVEDADRVLRSTGPAVADDFGRPLLVGDLDGDGLDDLVISAARDRHQGRPVGSVQVVYGHPAFFARP